MIELEKLRLRGVRLLILFSWACTLSLGALGLVFDLANEATTFLFSALINVLPTIAGLKRQYDLKTGALFGIAAAVQPALLVYLLSGHPWQMEAHMYFFVGWLR